MEASLLAAARIAAREPAQEQLRRSAGRARLPRVALTPVPVALAGAAPTDWPLSPGTTAAAPRSACPSALERARALDRSWGLTGEPDYTARAW
jgi:hypothetical protein